MVQFVRARIHSALRRAGVSLVPYPLDVVLKRIQPDVVLDVGANSGQYGRELRARGFRGQIVSFEPLADAHSELAEAASGDRDWRTVQAALGAERGEATIHRASNSASSSLRAPGAAMAEAAPHLAFESSETVRVERLDDRIGEVCPPEARGFLKVDTQGFELDVLRGAEASLDRMQAVQLESSLSPLYDGQPPMEEVLAWMRARGWVPGWIHPAYWTPGERRWIEADVLFVRAS